MKRITKVIIGAAVGLGIGIAYAKISNELAIAEITDEANKIYLTLTPDEQEAAFILIDEGVEIAKSMGKDCTLMRACLKREACKSIKSFTNEEVTEMLKRKRTA